MDQNEWVYCPGCKKKIGKKLNGIAIGEYQCRHCKDSQGKAKTYKFNTLKGLRVIGFEQNSQKEITLQLG